MYLKASRYIPGWKHCSDEDRQKFASLVALAGLTLDDVTPGAPSGRIEINVGYWRKANAIHSWFVREVQGGEDECKSHGVSKEQLWRLKALCEQVLADQSKAGELLPPKEGFFFGSTELDEGYLDDLRGTIKIVDRCLSDKFADIDFEYRSSW